MNAQLPKASGIYLITNLRDGKLYVGSALNIRKRIQVHLSLLTAGRHNNRHLQSAFSRDGGVAGFAFTALELCERSALLDREQVHMDALRVCDPKVGYNIIPRADRREVSPDTRALQSLRGKGRKLSPESIAKMAAARRGQKLSEEHKAKLRGRLVSAVTRAKLSALRKAKPQTADQQQKRAEAMRRPDVREKLRLAQTGKKASAEARAKMCAGHVGQPVWRHTPESRAAISAAKTGKIASAAVCAANRLRKLGKKDSPETRERKRAYQASRSSEQRAAFSIKCSAAAYAREQRKRELRT